METITTSQFLTFILRDEYFATEIFKVREVLDVAQLTRIPRMPDYITGVINLRGSVVPVVDLGLRLGMAAYDKTVNTCIMIVEIQVEDETDKVFIGVLTDAVQEVIDLSPNDIEPAPKMGTDLNTEFIKGLGKTGERFMILLDIDRVLTSKDNVVLQNMERTATTVEDVEVSESGEIGGLTAMVNDGPLN